MTPTSSTSSLQQFVGKLITGVRRVWYVLRDDVNDSAGPIEIAFADGSAVVLDAGPDGEALAISTARWVDPFEPPLSPENEQYVEASGRWTAFDVSGQAPYSALVGVALDGVEPHVNPGGKLIGATMRAGTTVVRAEVEGDEISVDVV
jgi:hypothetical protein